MLDDPEFVLRVGTAGIGKCAHGGKHGIVIGAAQFADARTGRAGGMHGIDQEMAALPL
jgi:hypothetical protein